MKVAYYCQHVLGIGHFHRSLEICIALAERHEVTLIVGGPPVDSVPAGITLFRLPGLQMDHDFQNLAPCEPSATLEETKEQRRDLLLTFFAENRPELFVVELYPFGRKAFRFELDPVLAAIREGSLGPCGCYVSLRDILVERPNDRDKFEKRAVRTLNRYFDGLLIHSDKTLITLDETFSRYNEIQIPVAYTGFVSRSAEQKPRAAMRAEYGLAEDDILIVASIGGGNVGEELLAAVLETFNDFVSEKRFHLQVFAGPYLSREAFDKLSLQLPPRARLDHFTDQFHNWLQAADLSISMAGYNTCMNIIGAGIPALVYPFAQNREQTFRATRLQQKASVRILTEEDLQRDYLASAIREMSSLPRYPVTINLQGAENSVRQLEEWHSAGAE